MRKQISIGAVISYITIGINIITGLFYTPWMIHTIGDSNYALYTLALSVINIFMIDFGLSSASTRFLSNYYACGEKENADIFLGITLRLYMIIDAVLFLVLGALFFCIELIYVKLTPNEIQTFKVLYCVVALYSIISFPLLNLNGILAAKEKFVSVKLCGLFQKILTMFFVVCALLLGGNVYVLVLANAGTGLLFCGIKIFLVKREEIKFDIRYKNRVMQKELLAFSVWSTVVQIMQRFIFSLAPTLLAIYVNSIEITYFSLASTIEGYVWIVGDAINGMFMPQIARLNQEKDADEKITNLMCKVGRFQILVIGMIVIIFGLIGRDFVLVWMGKGYEKVWNCAMLIILPALLDIPQQVGKTTMLVRNKIKLEAVVYILMVMIYLPFALVLTKKYGIIGTSVAILIAYTLRSAALAIIYKMELNLDIRKFYKSVYGHWSVASVLCILITAVLLHYIVLDGLKGLMLKGMICVAVYLFLCWLIVLNVKDVKSIISSYNKQ